MFLFSLKLALEKKSVLAGFVPLFLHHAELFINSGTRETTKTKHFHFKNKMF